MGNRQIDSVVRSKHMFQKIIVFLGFFSVFLLPRIVFAQAGTVVANCQMIGELYSTNGECRTYCLEQQVQLPFFLEQHIGTLEGISGTEPCANTTESCCLSQTPELETAIEGGTYLDVDNNVLQSFLSSEVDSFSGSEGKNQVVTQQIYDPLGGINISRLLGGIVRSFIGVAGSIAFLMFIYGGIMYILSGGKGEKVKKATTILKNSAIGIVLIFGAYAIVQSIIEAILAE